MIRLKTLGATDLRTVEGTEIRSVLAQPKRLALLAYLAIARPAGFHRRDVLLAMFWPEIPDDRARSALSQALYFLRRSLGPGAIETRGSDEVGVDRSRLWCDVVAFGEALDRGAADEAMDLYQGDLMPGFHLADGRAWEEWLDIERRALRLRAAEAAWALGESAAELDDAVTAVSWGRRAAELAPEDEGQLRRLISLLEGVGDRAAALRAYAETVDRLAAKYGIRPSAETEALAARLRRPAGAKQESVTREGAAQPVAGDDMESRGTGAKVAKAEVPVADPDGRRRGAKTAALAAGAVTIAATLGLFLAGGPTLGPAPIAETDPPLAVAVLPFEDFTAATGDGYLADGTTEEVTARLSKLAGLRVTARASVVRYRGTRLELDRVGSELGVQSLVHGSVRADDRRVRIAVSVVDVSSGTTRWSEQFEGDLPELLDLQGRVAEATATALGVRMRRDERLRVARRGTRHPEAHRLYLLGRESMVGSEPEGARAAVRYFERAVRVDSSYAEAWAALADAYDHLTGMNLVSAREGYPASRDAARRALELDPHSARAHAALAMALSFYYWDSDRAEHHFTRAIELDPSFARAHRTYAAHLRSEGRFDDARFRARTSVELDPADFYANLELAIIEHVAGRPDDAIAEARQLAERGPGYRYAWFVAALGHVQRSRFDEAIAALDAVDPDESLPDLLALRGYIHAVRGDVERARRISAALEERGPGFEFGRGMIHLGLGERDRALDLLEEATAGRDWRMRLLGVEPLFATLRSEPRFRRILERVGLDIDAR